MRWNRPRESPGESSESAWRVCPQADENPRSSGLAADVVASAPRPEPPAERPSAVGIRARRESLARWPVIDPARVTGVARTPRHSGSKRAGTTLIAITGSGGAPAGRAPGRSAELQRPPDTIGGEAPQLAAAREVRVC